MNFFFDANISYRLADMIAALEAGHHTVTHITKDPRFAHNNNQYGNSTKDVEYLTTLGQDTVVWVVISGDSRILDTAHERAALIQSGLTFFAMDHNWGKADKDEAAWKLVKIWGEIKKCASTPPPMLYRVNMGRRLSVEIIKA